MTSSTKKLAETPIQIYTDGSCINYKDQEVRAKKGYGGWAFIVVWAEDGNVYRQGRLDPPQTNQTAELHAILEALRYCAAQRMHKERVIIVSDSLYAINGMTSQFRHLAADAGFENVPNGDIWKRLHSLADQLPRVRYRHVRGHRGNKYNEMADRMASFARRGRANLKG